MSILLWWGKLGATPPPVEAPPEHLAYLRWGTVREPEDTTDEDEDMPVILAILRCWYS